MRLVYILASSLLILWLNLFEWNSSRHFLFPTEEKFLSDSPSLQRKTRMAHPFKLTSDKIRNLKTALDYVNRYNATNCTNGTGVTLAVRLDRTIWDTYANVAVKTANLLSKYLQINTANGSFLSDKDESFQQTVLQRTSSCSNVTWLELQRQFTLGEPPNVKPGGAIGNTGGHDSYRDANIHMLLYLLVQNNVDTDSPVIFGSAVAFEPYVVPCLEKYSPYAHKLDENGVNVEDLSSKYNYLDSTISWYSPVKASVRQSTIKTTRATYGSRLNTKHSPFTYTYAEASLEDGHWTNPYFDCGGGNVWMVTFSAPILWIGSNNFTYFRGVATIDIHLTNIDINQCDDDNNDNANPNDEAKNIVDIFRGTHSCQTTTKCVHVPKYGFQRGSYRCVCKDGYYLPGKDVNSHYFNGSEIENSYRSKLHNWTTHSHTFRCVPCARLCKTCTDSTPCMYQENIVFRLVILVLSSLTPLIMIILAVIACYIRQQLVIKSASPIFLFTMCLGAGIMSLEVFILYLEPTDLLCQLVLWPKHFGFVIMYGSLILKTWRISIIFKVSKSKQVKIPDKILVQRLLPMIAIIVAGLTVCTIKSPSRAVFLTSSSSLKYISCSTNIWNYVFYASESLMLLYGVYLCFRIRKVPAFFNESRYITWSTYNALIFGSFLNIFIQFVKTSVGPDITYLLNFLSIQISGTVTVALIFLPKFYALHKIKRGQLSNTEAIRRVMGRLHQHNILGIDLHDKSSQTDDHQIDEQSQSKLSLEADEIPDSCISAPCEIILTAEGKKKTTPVVYLKQLHSWPPRRNNKIAAITLKGAAITGSSNSNETL